MDFLKWKQTFSGMMKRMIKKHKPEAFEKNEDILEQSAATTAETETAETEASAEEAIEVDAEVVPEPEEIEEELDPIAEAEEKAKEANDKYLRLMAEFDNFKKRTAGEYGKLIEGANKNLMNDLITVRESFERALNSDKENHDAEAFLEGMKMIFRNLDDNLTKHGLQIFGEVGDAFNPALHDAMMKQPSAEIPEDHIVTIFEKGYKLKDQIVRHAKVVVSAGE